MKTSKDLIFDPNDDCFARAKNILKFTGLRGRWYNTPLLGNLAEAINIYMEVDKVAETKSRNGEQKR
jgi:hypothetical protein